MVVYIDVLFSVNLFINYLLLRTTSHITRLNGSRFRAAFGAILGAIYACLMFFPNLNALFTVPSKIAISFIIVITSFKLHTFRQYFRAFLIFYLSSFILGGVTLAILYFSGTGRGSMISNGIFYFNLPWKVLFLSSGAAYVVIRLAFKVYNLGKSAEFKAVTVRLGGNEAELFALVDTGNMLEDPLSHCPVVVAEFAVLKKILPGEISEIFSVNAENDLEKIVNSLNESEYKHRFRLIPFSSLGAPNGMLLGFKPDNMAIGNKDLSNVTVGICNGNLCKSGNYNALVSPEVAGAADN